MSKQAKKATDVPEEATWHELTDFFDADKIKKLPVSGRVFLMGQVDDAIVVEVPAATSQQEIEGFQRYLVEKGMTSVCLVVPDTVRFLKLTPCDAETTAILDKSQEEAEDDGSDDDRAGD